MPKVKVLFLQASPVLYADSHTRAKVMRYLDRSEFEVHVAFTAYHNGQKSDAYKLFEAIPDLHLRPTNFGPSFHQSVGNTNPLSTLSAPVSLIGLGRYIKQHEIQVIHCSEKPREAFYGYWLARGTGAKLLIHLHVKVENWISPLSRWVMKRTDSLVGVSAFAAQSAIAMGFPANRTSYILNGLDLSAWNEPASGDVIRQEFSIAPEVPILASVGRLVYYKGQAELIQAMAIVKRTIPVFKLLIVGERGDSSGEYIQKIKTLVKDLGIEDMVIFTGQRKDVSQILAACQIFALPSFEEPFGNVFVEAMWMKKPVVALDNGGVREIVQHGKSGLLSAPKDIEQMAKNIITLLQNPSLCAQMGEYGKQQVEKCFNATRMAHDFEQHYKRVVGENTGT